MTESAEDLAKRAPKTPGSALIRLGLVVGLLGLAVFGVLAVTLSIFGFSANDQLERDFMFAGAIAVAWPGTILFGLLAWWMRRLIRRQTPR